jgi:hypothetical protein
MSMSTDSQMSARIQNGETESKSNESDFQGSVVVVFTSTNRTLKALEKAGELAKPLGGRVVVVAAEVIPYILPLDEAPVRMEFILRRFAEMANQIPIKFLIIPCLCRSRLEALRQLLHRNSPVMIGIRKRWWPTRDERLARELRRAGYAIISVEGE